MKKRFRILSIILMLVMACSAFLTTSCNKDPEDQSGLSNKYQLIHGGTVTETSDMVVSNGKSDYVVVIPTENDGDDRVASNVFTNFFQQATGVMLPVKTDSEVVWSEDLKAISLGQTKLAEDNNLSNEHTSWKESSFKIQTKGKSIFVLADDYGVICGAQELLYYMFNFEYFAEYVYSLDRGVADEPLCIYDITEVPDIEGRINYVAGITNTTSDAFYKNGLRLNGHEVTGWGAYSHNSVENVPFNSTHVKGNQAKLAELFDAADPADGYGALHRDWYTERVGSYETGVPDQMCYSKQDEYFDIILNKCKVLLIDNPTKNVIDYSIEDTPTWCTCKDCLAAKTKYGSGTALFYKLLSRLAKEINEWIVTDEAKALTPTREVFIQTLAYHMTYEAPAKYNEEKGVYEPCSPDLIIDEHLMPQYCTRGADLFAATNASSNAVWRDNMLAWGDICKQIGMWKYNQAWYGDQLQFNPFFSCMQEDYQFIVSRGVEFMMDEGAGGTTPAHTAFQVLRQYLQSKLAWNAYIDYEDAITRYFTYCYGPAAETMRTIFDCMESNLHRQYLEGKIRGTEHWLMQRKYYAKGFLETILAMYDVALEQVYAAKGTMDEASWNRLEQRVSIERLSPIYMYVEIWETDIPSADLLSWRLQFKEDAIRLKITNGGTSRTSSGISLQALLEFWGIA